MKKVDLGEFHNTNQYNDFSEYQPFPAERYYTYEAQKPAAETQNYDESYENKGTSNTVEQSDGQADLNDIKKEYDNLNGSDSADSTYSSNPSMGTDTSTTTTSTASTSSSQTAVSTSGSASAAGGVAGGAAASAGATAVAAVVIVSAAIGGGFIANFDNHVNNISGMDYVSITVDIDEVLSQSDKAYSLTADNFFIEFNQGETPLKIALTGGKHNYLVTGLLPEKTYSYSITCNNAALGSNSSCYSGSVTTKSTGEPECVLDELNNYVTYDEATQTASVNYSLYLSDCEKIFSSSTLYICSSEQSDFSAVNNVVYSSEELDENNFFKGSADGITYEELYMYVVGQTSSQQQTEVRCLYSQKIELDLPDGWVKDDAPTFVIDEGEEAITSQPDSISISGALSDLNRNFTYYAYITQYAEDGTILVERQEGGLIVDPENMTYSVNGEAYYGVNKFTYVIYSKYENGNEATVYDSGEKQFTASQEFGATYTKVEPADATIEYTSSGVTITANTGFTSQYSNYEYKLVVTNSAGKVYGEYQGKRNAVITIENYVGLDEINFTYYDFGTFADGEVELASHTTAPITGNVYFAVDESAEAITSQPDSISISGTLTDYNKNYTYSAYVNQYNEDGTALIERQEVSFEIDSATMTYTIESGAYYGVKSFKYVVYTNDGTNETVVYNSGSKEFTADQSYSATYTKVEPADATIEYTSSGVTITANTGFTSEYSNYEYKLVVTNSAGKVYGEYQGKGNAVITIENYVGLDEINFTYYDLGTFAEGEVELASHTTTPITGNAYFAVDETAEKITQKPDNIAISGTLTDYNKNYTYSAYVNQYNEDGTALIERQEVSFEIDPATMTYTIESGAYYGVKSFEYVVYTNDGTNETVVYNSGSKEFTASQEFGATYTQVQPADATIEYTSSGVTITATTDFSSTYSNYEYKLVVTNSAGKVYGDYQGTGEAVITIENYVGLDEINFTYYDLVTFADGEVELASHTTEGVAFCMPTLSLDSESGFDGQYFTLSYTCDMIYDYAQASMDIEVIDGDGTTYSKHVDSVSEKGIITLDNIQGEVGNVTVKATLNFTDNQSDGAVHSLQLAQAEYVMNYSFEVTKVVADVSAYSSEMMSVKLNFDYTLPDGYMVKITDDANAIDLTLPLAEMAGGYSINDLAMDTAYNLTIQATDADGNAWGEAKTINISKSAAEAEYTSPTMSCLNPGDAVVTYNEDGTINIYREMIPDAYGRDTVSDDERVYYNAVVHVGDYDESYNFIETVRYDVIGRGKYAVLENIPKENYTFVYYQMFDFNGVSYVMYTEIPSGSVETVYDCGTAVATVANGQTTISANILAYGKLDNRIIVNGTEYTYTTYSNEYETNPTLVIEGEIDVTEVTIFFTEQGYNYDAYGASGEITMKGSKYGEYTLIVETAQA